MVNTGEVTRKQAEDLLATGHAEMQGQTVSFEQALMNSANLFSAATQGTAISAEQAISMIASGITGLLQTVVNAITGTQGSISGDVQSKPGLQTT